MSSWGDEPWTTPSADEPDTFSPLALAAIVAMVVFVVIVGVLAAGGPS